MAETGRSLKRYFLTGLFVLIPVVLTFLSVGWLVQALDGLAGEPFRKLFGVHIPGLGLVLTVGLILVVGMLLSNVIVQHVFELFEEMLLHVPGVRAVYKTIKALTEAFSPSTRESFQKVVLAEYPHPGALSMGFVTKRFTVVRGTGSEPMLAVYVPTNHVYLGNTIVVPESKVIFTPLTVEQGIQIALSSGASFPESLPELPRRA